jgi:uroporphyrinogen decarboxylase
MKITEARLRQLADQIHERVAQEAMTPLKRFEISNRFCEPDRIPVILQIHDHAARLAGLAVREICENPSAHVYSQLVALLEYGHDLPCGFADCYNVEVEALGAPLVYAADMFPEIGERILRNRSDLERLALPDFSRSGRMPWVLEVNAMLADLLGDIMGAYAAVTAPFSIAANLRGYEQLIADIMEDREFAHQLMEFCTRIAAGFGQIQLEHGAMATSIIDAWASPPLVSMEIFDEFVLPYTARAIGMLSPPGASWGGIWGCSYLPDWRDLVRRVIAAGSRNVRAFGEDFQRKPGIDPVEFKSILKTHRRPMLYCVTAGFMSQGTPSEICDKVKTVIRQIGSGGGVTMYGAMVPQETPPENVRAFVNASKQIGRYPIPK